MNFCSVHPNYDGIGVPPVPTKPEPFCVCRQVALGRRGPVSGSQPRLPIDSAARKEIPIVSGVLDYFPDAIAAVAALSKRGNDKHNPGEPLHWSRNKSTDHVECIARHLVDRGTVDPEDGILHDVKLAWRALANLQLVLEQRHRLTVARGSVPTYDVHAVDAGGPEYDPAKFMDVSELPSNLRSEDDEVPF